MYRLSHPGWIRKIGTIFISAIWRTTYISIKYLESERANAGCEVFNLGSGNGVSVLEAIHAFEEVGGVKLNYGNRPRRPAM